MLKTLSAVAVAALLTGCVAVPADYTYVAPTYVYTPPVYVAPVYIPRYHYRPHVHYRRGFFY